MMERYCIQKYDRKNFCESSGGMKYWTIDIEKIIKSQGENTVEPIKMSELGEIKIQGLYNFLNNKSYDLFSDIDIDREEIKEYNFIFFNKLKNIVFSREFELDILNDLYLSLSLTSEKKEALFLEEWFSVNSKKIEDGNDVVTVKQTINNYKKSVSNQKILFAMDEFNTTKRNMHIGTVGSNVKRLWLLSPRFRKLFTETETRYEKYKLKEILDILVSGRSRNLVYEVADRIVLEKLLGLNTMLYFWEYIVSIEKKSDFELFRPLLKAIMKCRGSFSRCLLIQYVGLELKTEKETQVNFNLKKKIPLYSVLIEDMVNIFEKNYLEVYHIVMEEMSKKLSYEECFNMIEGMRKKVITSCGPMVLGTEKRYEQLHIEIAREITKVPLNDKQVKIIENTIKELKEYRLNLKLKYPYYINEFEDIMYFEDAFIEEELQEKIQAYIINENYKTYN